MSTTIFPLLDIPTPLSLAPPRNVFFFRAFDVIRSPKEEEGGAWFVLTDDGGRSAGGGGDVRARRQSPSAICFRYANSQTSLLTVVLAFIDSQTSTTRTRSTSSTSRWRTSLSCSSVTTRVSPRRRPSGVSESSVPTRYVVVDWLYPHLALGIGSQLGVAFHLRARGPVRPNIPHAITRPCQRRC